MTGPGEKHYSIENEICNILYRGVYNKNAGICWSDGTDSDFCPSKLETDGTVPVSFTSKTPALIDQELSEYERKGWSWHQDNLADEFDITVSEAIAAFEEHGWTHKGRGLWSPPSRM